ncbi:MAG: type II toxin-antitoxin system prevent-host-death family antitoxin [Actinobacteria bacterium]|jgi:prevent-host-death family protein|nr:type II toxin-antitoxin system prevent-host-death family antitoxin [Actinomycetota bacterium]
MSIAAHESEHKHSVGIRALKQNASEVVARAAAGEIIQITDRGRPVAQLAPLHQNNLESLTAAGRITLPTGSLVEFFDAKKLLDAADPARSLPTIPSAELLHEQREDRV